jgi:membrane protease subunit HflC
VGGVKEPGLHTKIPFVQDVILFEQRLLDYDARPAEILTSDKKNLVVDNFAKWRIVDPLKFYKTVRDVRGASSRLDDIIFAELRVELGRHDMVEIISELRSEIMAAVTERSDEASRQYGIEVVDVRIKRADLPQENERAVFGRMQAEREREAKLYRSEGQEQALKIRAIADRQRAILLAEANRKSQEIRGEADAQATSIYAHAYRQDEGFYSFMRSLESYRQALDEDATLLLTTDQEYLDYFRESGAKINPPASQEELEQLLESYPQADTDVEEALGNVIEKAIKQIPEEEIAGDAFEDIEKPTAPAETQESD